MKDINGIFRGITLNLQFALGGMDIFIRIDSYKLDVCNLAFRGQRWSDCEFQDSSGHIVRPDLKKKTKMNQKQKGNVKY